MSFAGKLVECPPVRPTRSAAFFLHWREKQGRFSIELMEKWFINLARVGVVLALVVVTMGAWVRLTDAGLGCPDWPGCYGRLVVSEAIATDPAAAELTAQRPLEAGKAWREMIHRYFATGVGFICLLLAGIAIARRREPG